MTMLRKKHRIRPLQAGFTLIELLIVVVILAILAAIVVFAVGGSRTNALQSSCKADAKSLETALEAWKANNGNGAYPTPPSSATDKSNPAGGWGALLQSSAGGNVPYLRAVPSTDHYTLWWDSTGAVGVGGPNATYVTPVPSGNNYDTASNACSVAS